MQEIQERAVNARQAMAVPNFQASKLPMGRPACGSTPLICQICGICGSPILDPQRRNSCRKGGALTPGAQSCALPRSTFLRQALSQTAQARR